MKYLKKSAGYVVLIIALLFLQAYCDLSLPDYTSKIVNVGIQQSGIEDSVPEKIRKTSMDNLKLFMDEEDKETIDSYYEEDGDNLVLKEDVKSEEREKLNDILVKPMMIAASFSSGSDEVNEMLAKMGVPEGTDPMQAIAQMPEEALTSMIEKISEKIDKMQPSILTQAGVAYVKSEYEAMGEDVDAIQMHYIKISGVKMLGMALITMLCAICVVFLSSRVAAALGHDLRNAVYNKVISFSSREYHKFSTASLITRCTNDIQQVQQVMAMFFRIVLYAPILGIGGVLKIIQTGAGMGWIIILAILVILGYVMVLMAVTMPRFKLMQKLVDKINLVSREILTGLSVIRAFGRETEEEKRFDDANKDLTKTMLFTNRVMTFMMPGMMLIMNLLTVGIVWVGAHKIDAGSMQVGSMTAFITYAMMIVMAFLMLTAMSIMLPRAAVAAERIDEVINTESSIEDAETPEELKEHKGVIRFSHVSFRYPGAEADVLEDIDFTAEPGKTTAIIGSTGCGKSTLVNLIPRLYDVTDGSVTLDGQDIRNIRMEDLREEIGFVPQKGVLFSGTIASNLRFGKRDATDEEIKEAAAIAQATDFIEEKQEKYDSDIAQGGSNVSGGQKQRLAIARAIAKQPKIYVFDDSFSALDLKTDAALRKALASKVKDSTVIIVAQRISTILHAEQILVLDDGRIVGKGTHEELLKNCETYRQIARSQLSAKELGIEESEVSVNE